MTRNTNPLLGALLALILFAMLAISKFLVPHFEIFDARTSEFIFSYRNDAITAFVIELTELIDLPVMLGMLAVLGLIFWIEKRRLLAVLLVGSVTISFILVKLFKFVFQIARPDGGLMTLSSYSFPSGHTAIATAFFLFMAFLFTKVSHRRFTRILFYFLVLVMIGGVGLARVYLGVHVPSDIIGGFLLGLFGFMVSISILKKWQLKF